MTRNKPCPSVKKTVLGSTMGGLLARLLADPVGVCESWRGAARMLADFFG